MKNFARVIDLGPYDCCVLRVGMAEVGFHFWMREGSHALDAYAAKNYGASWVVDALFDEHEDQLLDEALKTLDMVMHQIDVHSEHLEETEHLHLEGPALAMLMPPKQDDE